MKVIVTLLLLFAASTRAWSQTINVEVDYMENTNHSHMPQPAEVAALVQMFACHGWTLNLVIDDSIPHTAVIQCNNPGTNSFFTCNSSTNTTFQDLKNTYYDGPSNGWHYCIFGHEYDDGAGIGSSGIAEIDGDDLLVSMGSFTDQIGTAFERASTFAHELGHNLGLRHAPPTTSFSSGNYQPNYASIMSYHFQTNGVRSQLECLGLAGPENLFKEMDYSNGRLATLFEVALDESVGVGIRTTDFDCDGSVDSSPLIVDLDTTRGNWCGNGGGIGILADYDDWANIVDSAFTEGVFYRELPYVTCLTAEAGGGPSLPDPSQCPGTMPTLTSENCVFAQMIWVDPNAATGGDGRGDSPYQSLNAAVSAATDNSVLYLQPGAYTGLTAPFTITKPLTLAGPGNATISP